MGMFKKTSRALLETWQFLGVSRDDYFFDWHVGQNMDPKVVLADFAKS